ncbi:hypothetical protein [Streptomyces olivoreticuli]|uniref:hypothetical protein n=1 Tax=Streptomyces olivoreticuli TaxID=68246 RepID=UPI0013C354C9|nr:hypothetical protein [Streptomyces olivoreticuli]
MPMVVGFRLGKDSTGYQLTAIASETGRIHTNHGLYGRPGRTERASNPTEPNAAHRAIASLRELHAKKLRQGYARTLIAPSVVRLDVAEVVPTERWGREAPSPELVEAFVAAAPAKPSEAGLEDAIRSFYKAIGSPARPEHFERLARTGGAPAPLPPQTAALLRLLAHGDVVASPARAAVGYTVSAEAVRLRVGRAGEDLDHAAVVELQAALSAWLRLNPRPRKLSHKGKL